MRRPTLVLAALVPLLVAPGALAQSANNFGSIYSLYGVGERVGVSSSQAAAMGGAGAALRSGIYVGLANPALWSDQTLVSLAVGAELQGLRAEDVTGEAARLTASGLSGLAVSLPLVDNRLGVALAFQPYSRTHYAAAQDQLRTDPLVPGDTLRYRVALEGAGGLHQVRLGAGWRLNDVLAVGASVDALFGVLDNRQRTTYTQPAGLGETILTRRTRMWGLGGTVGAVATFTEVVGSRDVLSVGASVALPTNVQVRRIRTTGVSLSQDTLRVESPGTATLPLLLQAGLAYQPDARWSVAADVLVEPWSTFESDMTFVGYVPGGANELRDRLRLAAGLQFLPAGDDRNAPYLARTAYRLGAYLDQGHVAPAGRDVTTLALTGGVSLPGFLPGARFDLGLEVGTRGTTEAGLVRDLFLKGTATINFGERWFIRRQFG